MISANPPTPNCFLAGCPIRSDWSVMFAGVTHYVALVSSPFFLSVSRHNTRFIVSPRGRVIYTLRVCYDYHIIKYSRRYKTGARLLLYTFPSSLCIGSQKKKRNTKFLDECVQECRVFIPLLNFSQQIQGVGGGRKVHICSTLPAFACCRRAAPILCRTTDNWMFLSIYYFFAACS